MEGRRREDSATPGGVGDRFQCSETCSPFCGPSTSRDPGQFLQIDPKIIVEKMDLRQRAADRARAGQPAANSASLDEVEQEIESTIRSIAAEDQARTYDQISTYEQRLRGADVAGSAVDMRVIARQAESDMESMLLAVGKGDLRVARKDVLDRERTLEAFKREKRVAAAGASAARAFPVLRRDRAAVRGGDLAQCHHPRRGRGTRHCRRIHGRDPVLADQPFTGLRRRALGLDPGNPRNVLRKLFGLVLAAACLGGVLLINLALAHYRAAVESGMASSAAAAAVIPLMKADPLALGDIMAIMVAMGVISALIVMLEGWLWDEPYPGYAEVSDHLRQAQARYHDMVEEKLDHLKSVQEEFVQKIQVERSRLRDRRLEIPYVMQERQRLVARFKDHLTHLQDVGRQALVVYRDTNRKARALPAPKRFDEVWHGCSVR